MLVSQAPAIDAGIALLRVTAGLTMASHAWAKISSPARVASTGRWFDGIGMRPGRIHAVAAGLTELGSGVLLAAGLLVALDGAAFVALMLVAGYTVHRKNGFSSARSGWEYNLVLAAVGASVAICGAGGYSLDHLVGIETSGVAGALIGIGGGLLAGGGQLIVFYRPTAATVSGTPGAVGERTGE